MKVEATQEQQEFKPIIVTITLETQEELDDVQSLVLNNIAYNRSELDIAIHRALLKFK